MRTHLPVMTRHSLPESLLNSEELHLCQLVRRLFTYLPGRLTSQAGIWWLQWLTYLLTYLSTYLLACLLTYTYLLTYLPTYLPFWYAFSIFFSLSHSSSLHLCHESLCLSLPLLLFHFLLLFFSTYILFFVF